MSLEVLWESNHSTNSMKDLPHHTTWAHRLQMPMAWALLTTALNSLQLQPLAATIMAVSQTISPLQASALQAHSIHAVLVAGLLEVHLGIPAPALLLIRRLRLTRQLLQIWVWRVRCTTHRPECRQLVQLSPLRLLRIAQRLQALVKPVPLQHRHSIHQLLPASLQLRQGIHRRRHNTPQRHRHSVLPRQRLQHPPPTARHLQAGVPRRPLMQVLLANRPRLLHHNTLQPLQRLVLRHQLSVRRLRLIRQRVQLSIHLREVRALQRVHNTRQTAQRAQSTLPSKSNVVSYVLQSC